MNQLNTTTMPSALIPLLPMAEKWGIGDDLERDAKVKNASLEELESLVHCIDEITDSDLFGWLSGPESENPKPSEEYLALTALTMAIDSAKLKLKKMRSK
ncbi:MAG: hypothetical protein WBS33_19170 [Verrucomicrobiia bacterium]